MGARLIGPAGGHPHNEIRLSSGRLAVGSGPGNDVVLADRTISQLHAILELTGSSCVVTDAGSTNGTFVDGQRITGATPVRDGDELRFGALTLVFRSSGPTTTSMRPAGAIGRSRWRAGLTILLLFAASTLSGLFVVYFSRLETAGEQSVDKTSPAASVATADTTALHSAVAVAPAALPPSNETSPKPWLDAVNRYRTMAGLATVRNNPALSSGATLHSRYIAKNYDDQIRAGTNLGIEMHREDASKPGFTAEGAAAGMAGDVDEMWDPGGGHRDTWAIDNWVSVPFHRLPILDARLRSVGYGDNCDASVCIATLNATSDLAPLAPSPGLATPIEYPPDRSTVKSVDLVAEWPDPLTSCPGYKSPAGLPITLQLGPQVAPVITSYALTLNDPSPAAVEACGIDAVNYMNPDAATQTMGRALLKQYGALIIIPRRSLVPGNYTVALTASGQDYHWSFAVIARERLAQKRALE